MTADIFLTSVGTKAHFKLIKEYKHGRLLSSKFYEVRSQEKDNIIVRRLENIYELKS